ncbi:hypothetical protein GALL_302590 [mine drainage metagenome]|uniref:Uncharacterized protein n=1 Tax=mine drainage metagenome TaxID=410659 RepID=A0A1J5QWE4_9ZZZZ
MFEVLSTPAHIREWWNVETGWREKGWGVAQLEAEHHAHVIGWDLSIARLGDYLARVVSPS